MSPGRRDERGIVLVAVLFFILLMVGAVATFLSRATVDGMIARNRDMAARCEALARGGVQLATALLLQDRLEEQQRALRVESRDEAWARVGELPLELPDGGRLRLEIEDAGARLNLNALFQDGAARDPVAEVFLAALFEKAISEMEVPADQRNYDPQELAWNLIDWVDADDVRIRGGPEDAFYQEQRPPYRAPNRPLLSFEELGLVEGFDTRLLAALRPYVTVFPWAGGEGVNPNTAPSYVLATLYHGTAGDYRLADEDTVRSILDIREGGGILCADEADNPACTPLRVAVGGEVFPPPTFTTDVFQVRAEATYGDIQRTIEAVLDRHDPTAPQVLEWRVR